MTKAKQKAALDELTKMAQEDGLYRNSTKRVINPCMDEYAYYMHIQKLKEEALSHKPIVTQELQNFVDWVDQELDKVELLPF